MSKKDVSLKRRGFFKWGASAAAGLAAHKALGGITGAQPLGPFFPNNETPRIPVLENPDPSLPVALANDNDLTFVKGRSGTAQGQYALINGKVTDKDGRPIEDAQIIIWQASSSGRYNHMGDGRNERFQHPQTGEWIDRELDPNFQYWGKTQTGNAGNYEFKTVVPGFYPADLSNGWYRPPHIHMMISALGKNSFVTQMYFRGEALADNAWIQELNQADLLLENPSLSPEQKSQLIVHFQPSNGRDLSSPLVGTFDVSMPD